MGQFLGGKNCVFRDNPLIFALLEDNEDFYWQQQDGATCYSSNESMRLHRGFFGIRLIFKDL